MVEPPSLPAGPRRSGSSLTPTPGSKGWPTGASVMLADRGLGDARTTRRESRSVVPLWQRSSCCRQAAARARFRDVLGFRTAEATEMLDSSEASVKGHSSGRARPSTSARPLSGRDRAPAPAFPARTRPSRGSPPRSSAATRTAPSRCSPMTAGSRAARTVRVPRRTGDRQVPAQPRGAARPQLVPTRANGHPAFGCYPDAQAPIARVRNHGVHAPTTTSPPSRGSGSAASSRTSDCHGRLPKH